MLIYNIAESELSITSFLTGGGMSSCTLCFDLAPRRSIMSKIVALVTTIIIVVLLAVPVVAQQEVTSNMCNQEQTGTFDPLSIRGEEIEQRFVLLDLVYLVESRFVSESGLCVITGEIRFLESSSREPSSFTFVRAGDEISLHLSGETSLSVFILGMYTEDITYVLREVGTGGWYEIIGAVTEQASMVIDSDPARLIFGQ